MKRVIKAVMMKTGPTKAIYMMLLILRYHGVKMAFAGVVKKLTGIDIIKSMRYVYAAPSDEQLESQRKTEFPKNVKFSILTPLYNTDKRFLAEMIESVQAQTYGNWELCMADGSDAEHGYVQEICEGYARTDGRIKYEKLERNLGIAENTNACLAMAAGEFISFLDHDDLLTSDALFETAAAICGHGAQFVYSDEDKVDADTTRFYNPVYKPDYAPDYLLGTNYICHFVSVSRDVAERTGLLRSGFDGAQDYDFVLRATQQVSGIYHVPKVLYHWRVHKASTASSFDTKSNAVEAGRLAVAAHLERAGLRGSVVSLQSPGTYRVRYELAGAPLVSIVIPNKDHIKDLRRCIESILKKTNYKNVEVFIVENNSESKKTFDYYKELESDARIKVVRYEGVFNYSKVNNFGVARANGDYIVFLNNDTQVLSEDWIEELLSFAQRDDVGVVGAKLYYKNFRVQHAGIVVGLHHSTSHVFYKKFGRSEPGYTYRLQTVQNYSAVTAACMMVKKDFFLDVGGFSEEYAVAYNDVDLCMKAREKGKLVVWTPFCELIHHELTTRGLNDTPEKAALEQHERTMFENRWSHYWQNGDPYYNVNLNRVDADFTVSQGDVSRGDVSRGDGSPHSVSCFCI